MRAIVSSGSAALVRGRRRKLRPAWVALLAAVVLGMAALYWMSRPVPAIDSLAILPFTNVGADPNKEYLSDGITEHLINSLSQLSSLRVTARSLAFRYKGPQVDPQKAGRDLHVRAVLTGRLTEREGNLNIQAELVNVEDGAQLWGGQFGRRLSEILVLQQEITREVSRKLRVNPTAEQQKRLAKRSTENTEAYQLYLKGRYYWNRRTEQTLKRAVEYFQQAIDKDPGYALAYAGLADCYVVYGLTRVEPPRQSGPKAKAAATKALEIDSSLAEPHAALAMILMQHDWNWAGAELEFQRSIELDPNYATAHHWHGLLLTDIGRHAEAVASIRRAQQLDPLSLVINETLGQECYYARRFDEAIEELQRTLDMDPTFLQALRYLGMAYEQKGMYRQAITELQKAFDLSKSGPNFLAPLGHAYAVSGSREKAREALANLQGMSKRRYVSPFDMAVIHTGLGEKESALEWLDKALEERSWGVTRVKVDPSFDSLRADPRFAGLLRRMKLE